MSTAPKKDKGLNKYSFRGLTPDQVNELTQEQVVELFRARMRRRFSRSICHSTQKLSTSTSDCTLNARRPKRTLNPEKSQSPSRPTSAMLSWCPRWSETTWLSTTAKPSMSLKSSSTWSVATWESSQLPTNSPATVRLVSVPQRVPLTPPLNDCTYLATSPLSLLPIITYKQDFRSIELNI